MKKKRARTISRTYKLSKCGQGEVAFDYHLKRVWEKISSGYLEKNISDSRNKAGKGPGVAAAPVYLRTSQKASVAE